MSRMKAQQTDQTHCSSNTHPIIFMNNIKEPIYISDTNLPSLKRQLRPKGSVELHKQTLEARQIIQRYYDQHDMRPFFNNRPGYKSNMDAVWKPRRTSVKYCHVKPRVNTNMQYERNRSISYCNQSRSIEVRKPNYYKKVISQSNTPNMSLYLQPSMASKEQFILPKITEQGPKKSKEVNILNITTQPTIQVDKPFGQLSNNSKLQINQSSQTINIKKGNIISYEVINTTIKPQMKSSQSIDLRVAQSQTQTEIIKQRENFKKEEQKNIQKLQQKLQQKQQQQQLRQQQKEAQKQTLQQNIGAFNILPRKPSLQSQAFTTISKPNFDLNKFAQKMNNEGIHTNRGSTHSTSFNLRKNINPDITQETMGQIVKQFKPKSDVLSNIDSSNFQIKKYKNGVYFGELTKQQTTTQQNEYKNGFGSIFYYNGRLYEGQFKRDFKDGKGYELYPDSSYYHGDFKAGHKQGKGVFVWNNGEMYWGEWSQGKKHGSGTWKGVEGSKDSYFGQWFNGKPHGFGVLTNSQGDVYEGQFKLSVKDGKGTERFSSGDVYVGQYLKGRRSGPKQTMYYSNGQVFVGQFCNNVRHGKGILKSPNQTLIYEGQYRNDKKCGEGILWLENGEVYQGNFQNDLMHGHGKIKISGGQIRTGYWVNGKQMYEPRQHHTLHHDLKDRSPLNSQQKRNLRTVKSQNKISDLRKAYLVRKREAPSVQLPKHRRACGCLKKH